MHTFKRHITALLFWLFVISVNTSFAAFPILAPITMADSPVTARGERVYSVNAEPAPRETYSYRRQNSRFSKPYKNHDREAKLAFTFGMLVYIGLYPLAIPALILGIIGADRRNRYYNRAIWGIILGAIPILIAVISLIAWIIML